MGRHPSLFAALNGPAHGPPPGSYSGPVCVKLPISFLRAEIGEVKLRIILQQYQKLDTTDLYD